MRVFPVSEKRFLLQLEHGEEVKAMLCEFAHEHHIGVGLFRALGAAERSELDFYHVPKQQHERIAVDEPTEVAALIWKFCPGPESRPSIVRQPR